MLNNQCSYIFINFEDDENTLINKANSINKLYTGWGINLRTVGVASKPVKPRLFFCKLLYLCRKKVCSKFESNWSSNVEKMNFSIL
jgi:hypothetical protein